MLFQNHLKNKGNINADIRGIFMKTGHLVIKKNSWEKVFIGSFTLLYIYFPFQAVINQATVSNVRRGSTRQVQGQVYMKGSQKFPEKMLIIPLG